MFTSSAAASIASPFTALYAATKSFISSFGASLAVEVRHHGIDVLVFHPSPVNTRHALSTCISFMMFEDEHIKVRTQILWFLTRNQEPENLHSLLTGDTDSTLWQGSFNVLFHSQRQPKFDALQIL